MNATDTASGTGGAAPKKPVGKLHYFALILAAATLLGQTAQFFYTDREQRIANQDTQWREAVKNLSFQDPHAPLVNALSMQGFFGSTEYGQQAISIAIADLPLIHSDPQGFDEVFFELVDNHTDSSNQDSIFGISRTILDSQQTLYASYAVTSLQDTRSAVALDSMLGGPSLTDFQSNSQSHSNCQQAATASWELDSVSQGLHSLWVDTKLSPADADLGAIVLENGDFHTIRFSGAGLGNAVIYKVRFDGVDFGSAKLRNSLMRHVCLNGADLSQVTDFGQSQWTDTNWWQATLSKRLKDYLTNYNAPSVNEKNHIEATCKQPPSGLWVDLEAQQAP